MLVKFLFNIRTFPPMTPLLILPKLFLAGGAFLGTLQVPPSQSLDNHTLAGEKIKASQVVTRSQWGTPMLPDGKGGYSLIAPIDQKLIAQSLWIPPVSGKRPSTQLPVTVTSSNQPVAPAPDISTTAASASAVSKP